MSSERLQPDDASADDQQWFELLAGRSVGDVPAATRDEAAVLRAALLAYAPEAPPGAAPDPAARTQRLIDKARQAGVLPTPSPAKRPSSLGPSAWWRRPVFAGAAGLAFASVCLVVVLRVAVPEAPPADAERGAAVQQLVVPDPAARQQALLQALRAAGLDAQPFERLGRPGVDIALPVPLPSAQARALVAQGLQSPGGPSLRVELLQAPSRPASAVPP